VSESEQQRQYREVYLRSDHWRQMRQLALRDAEDRCAVCNSSHQLDVHHRTYERLGAERLTDLLVLCRKCHQVFHESRRLVNSQPPPKKRRPSKAARKRAQGLAIRESRRKAKAKRQQFIGENPLRGALHIDLAAAAPSAPVPPRLQPEASPRRITRDWRAERQLPRKQAG
jgi:hypothetical protein